MRSAPPLPAEAAPEDGVVIEVTRLVGRRAKGRLPTGVDRVALAYIQHYGLDRCAEQAGRTAEGTHPPAHALVRLGRWCWVLPTGLSQQVFAWLLSDGAGDLAEGPAAALAGAVAGAGTGADAGAGAASSASADSGRAVCSCAATRAVAAGRMPRPTGLYLLGAALRQLPLLLASSGRWPNGLGPRPWLVNVLHSGLEHAHWAHALRAQGARVLLLVHDLIPLSHPQFCRAGEAERHGRRMRHALAWGHAVVANSQATLDALNTWAAQQGLPVPPATVAHLGTGPAAHGHVLGTGHCGGAGLPDRASQPVTLAQPYFVVLGTLEPRKNHDLLLKLWTRLVQRHGPHAAPRLVLIGQRGWEIDSLLRALQRTPELQGVVIEQPHCSDAALAAWLQRAQALLFPSFVEGFGMPLTEALAAGVPVLCSDLPVFREVAADVPDYLDPLDGPGWLAALEDYAANGPRRAAQMARLRSYRPPGWAQHFQAVDRLMARVSSRANASTNANTGTSTSTSTKRSQAVPA